MTVSNSTNYIVSSRDIIQEALEQLGVLGEGEEVSDDQYRSSLRTLNMMVKNWQADGLNLFAVQELYLFPKLNQKKYSLNNSTTDHITTSFVETTTSAAASSSASTVVLTSGTGIADNDYIGIKLSSSEALHWTTVSDASGSPSIVLTDALPDDVDSGAVVYAYTTKADRPMKLLETYIHRFNGTEVPVGQLSRLDYNKLSDKDTTGTTNQIYFDPQLSASYVTLWPVNSSERDYFRLVVQRTLNDFDCSNNTPDYPQEWHLPLAFGLAVLVSNKYGTPDSIYKRVFSIAAGLYDVASGFDEEANTSVYFSPSGNYQ